MNLICFFSLITLLACGKQEFPDYTEKEEAFFADDETASQGKIRFLPGKKIRGTYLMTLEGDQFYVKINVQNTYKNIRIQQYLHAGQKCPGTYSDINGDGRVDYDELVISSGAPLIPLDKKLNSSALGNEWFPETDESGSYSYSRSGSLRLIKEDLDSLNVLSRHTPLDLRKRTLIFFGSPDGPLDPIGCVEL